MTGTTPAPVLTDTRVIDYDPARLRVELVMQLGSILTSKHELVQQRIDKQFAPLVDWVLDRAEEAYLTGVSDTVQQTTAAAAERIGEGRS